MKIKTKQGPESNISFRELKTNEIQQGLKVKKTKNVSKLLKKTYISSQSNRHKS